MRPHDHIGWVFAGVDEFAALAVPFLAEGASMGERLMYVAEDPRRDELSELSDVLERGTLEIASIDDVYGPTGVVDAAQQRSTFAEALATAISEGYTGIRVAADNTPLVSDPERLAAWIRWEIVADRFMSENQVTGLCAFDRRRIDVDGLRHLATLHPLSTSETAIPQFRLFADNGSLWVEGEVDSFALEHVWMALEILPAKTDLVVDLAGTALVTRGVMSSLRQLCADGVAVTIRGATESVRQLGQLVGMPDRGLSWVDA